VRAIRHLDRHGGDAALVASGDPVPGVATRRLVAAADASSVVGLFQLDPVSRQQASAAWRVTVTNPNVGRRVAELLDGHLRSSAESGIVEVVGQITEVGILLAGPDAVRLEWFRSAASPACDGTVRAGRPCACPPSFAVRRASVRRGRGCEPHVRIRFRLRGTPELGLFSIVNGNWSFAQEAVSTARVLRERGRPVCCSLSLRQTTCTLRSGRSMAYTRAALRPETLKTPPIPR